MHRATNRFWRCFVELPEHIQKLAKKNFDLLKEDPLHPSLHFKKVGKFWSVRIGSNYRALAVRDEQGLIWVWIGDHKEYDKMIKEIG
ncbi:hypothetical protein J7M23_03575 [Candidatus Sumerlaeota bacterium]|nr:hypothetical protein [Candidatus Sumerlaeota bacterium]